ncbi:hypothetical protein F5Y15DRAFT_10519 [Xylariaceae sp. FL0016]|nr:hypothetical protein F5Y15DRAFT_10519 [Xylariaceae sp. FL0016]
MKMASSASDPEPPPETADITTTDAESNTDPAPARSRRKRRFRDANVYEAVAGRVTSNRAIDDGSASSTLSRPRYRRRLSPSSHRNPTLAPDEVLFRRQGAPVRYAEKDIYYAHENLVDGGRDILPDSDMLKAIHAYASGFYGALGGQRSGGRSRRNLDERSMDETALLAMGILLEEAGREVLGQTGDMVFTEGIEIDQAEGSGRSKGNGNATDIAKGEEIQPEDDSVVEGAETVSFMDVLRGKER